MTLKGHFSLFSFIFLIQSFIMASHADAISLEKESILRAIENMMSPCYYNACSNHSHVSCFNNAPPRTRRKHRNKFAPEEIESISLMESEIGWREFKIL